MYATNDCKLLCFSHKKIFFSAIGYLDMDYQFLLYYNIYYYNIVINIYYIWKDCSLLFSLY